MFDLAEEINESDSFVMKIAKKAINKGAMQKIYELNGLLEFIQDKPMKTIVEIGTAAGGTFYSLCQIAPLNAQIISIDMPGGPFSGGENLHNIELFKKYLKKEQTAHFIIGDSHQESIKQELAKHLNEKKIDILFIDGDHTYEGVKKDFEMYSEFVKKQGIIIFHDICFHDVPECQVEKFWKEIKDNYEHKEIIDLHETNWGGIGIIIL